MEEKLKEEFEKSFPTTAMTHLERAYMREVRAWWLSEISKNYISREEVEKLRCSECDGSGAISTPSSHGPCPECDGTGFNLEDGCFNDIFFSLDKKTTL